MVRRPWYGFVYYVLGAQGSFFAWLVAIFGLYFTAKEALLFALNLAPSDATVAEIVSGDNRFRRWVRVGGVELDLGALEAAASGERREIQEVDTVLVGRDDAVAARWRDLYRRIDALGAGAGTEPDARLKEQWRIVREVCFDPEGSPFLPHQAIVLIVPEIGPALPTASAAAAAAKGPGHAEKARPGAPVSLSALGPAASDGPADVSPAAEIGAGPPRKGGAPGEPGGISLFEEGRRRMAARVKMLSGAARLDVTREGLLTPLPESKRQRYRERYGVEVGRLALVVGHRPSRLVAGLCAGFAVLLLFLVVGLRAVGRTGPSSAPAPPA